MLSLDSVRSTALGRVLAVLVGIGLLAASARLSVPFYPVPLTMQTLAVLLVGGLLGPTAGAGTVLGYLALGAMGAPVFANGLGGMAVLAGPTGGYLVGFVPAAWLIGWAARKGRSGRRPETRRGRLAGILRLALGAVAAGAVIYGVGVPWLAVVTGMSLREAVAAGLTPFLLGDLLKTLVAIAALRVSTGALSRRMDGEVIS
jgi:biotin transport system substrate-specific component